MNIAHETAGTIFDYAIVGGGIVGLATALRLLETRPGRVLLLEKESALAQHQTGRNSGVIHSGIYYKPGSLKAQLATAGNRSMRRFCEEQGIAHEVCGKLIIATAKAELPLLNALHERAQQNGVAARLLNPAAARALEPHARCLAAIHIPDTGIVCYRAVAKKMAELIVQRGGEIVLAAEVLRLRERAGTLWIETSRGTFQARFVVNCGGLHSDRIARQADCDPGAKIVPFRGEYYELVPEKRHLIKGLIYPVPNPAFPFLGVHFTRMIDGGVHAGPNAVLAFRREGYRKTDVTWRDLAESLGYPGFWKLAARHWDEGCREWWRSLSKAAFVRSLQRLVPEVTADDLMPCASGVRAQALRPDGSLVDDFLIVRGRQSLHVCNAPSPAATASLEIAQEVTRLIPEPERIVAAAA